MKPRHVVCAVSVALLSVVGCRSEHALAVGALADPCGAPLDSGVGLRVTSAEAIGAVQDVRELSVLPGRVQLALMADSGLYSAAFTTDSLVVGRRIARWGQKPGQVLMVNAITAGPDGAVTVFDLPLHRIDHWGASGTFKGETTIGLSALADDYVGGGGHLVAVTSQPSRRRYGTTTGELRELDSLGYPTASLVKFPTPTVHVSNGPRGAKLLPRPLEDQPIVRWSPRGGWVVASTDSLELHVRAAGTQRTLIGSGVRAPIDSAARDSSVAAFVQRTGTTGARQAEARFVAENTFFGGRTTLQLIDDVVPLLDNRFAVRRMRLCRDRHGWNVLDSLGRQEGTFAVPLSYHAVAPVDDGILFRVQRGDTLLLSVVPLARSSAVTRTGR